VYALYNIHDFFDRYYGIIIIEQMLGKILFPIVIYVIPKMFVKLLIKGFPVCLVYILLHSGDCSLVNSTFFVYTVITVLSYS
jgi:hypothetical protein